MNDGLKKYTKLLLRTDSELLVSEMKKMGVGHFVSEIKLVENKSDFEKLPLVKGVTKKKTLENEDPLKQKTVLTHTLTHIKHIIYYANVRILQ